MNNLDLRTLIEGAYQGVVVVRCPLCKGSGEIETALHLPCPRCQGSGKTTTSEEVA